MATELKVSDLEISCYANLMEQWGDIDAVFLQYVNIISDIKNHAVKSGETHEALNNLYYYANDIYTKICGVGTTIASIGDGFISDIEAIDLNLYNGV